MNKLDDETLLKFATESNKIERIYVERRHLQHAAALKKLLALEELRLEDLQEFVTSIQPDARLRTASYHRVWIGGREAPPASESLPALMGLLDNINKGLVSPLEAHKQYEYLHPFIDGNGRSGRAIWLWQQAKQGYDGRYLFLQMYYYSTLVS